MRKGIYRLYDMLLLHRSPQRVALGACLGFLIGVFPLQTLQVAAAICVAWIVRLQGAALLGGIIVGEATAFVLAAPLHELGRSILLAPNLHRLWSGLAHLPLFPFTDFNRTNVMGTTVLCLGLPVAYAILYRRALPGAKFALQKFRFSRLGERWFQSPFVLGHGLYNQSRRRPKEISSWIRWSGVGGVVGFSAIAALGVVFFGEAQLKQSIESLATLKNGSPVTIQSLAVHPWKGTLEMQGVEVAHASQPNRNFLAFDNITLHFDPVLLLSEKLIFSTIHIKGVRYAAPREGASPLIEPDHHFLGSSIFDRVAPHVFLNLKGNMGEMPFQRLGFLVTGIDLKTKLEAMRPDWVTQKEMRKLVSQVESAQYEWDRSTAQNAASVWLDLTQQKIESFERKPQRGDASQLSELSEDIRSRFKRSVAVRDEAQTQHRSFQQALAHYPQWIALDLKRLTSSLSMPRSWDQDVTSQLFGPTVLSYLERAAHWSDLTRRRMSAGTRVGSCVAKVVGPYSHEIMFGKMSALPKLLIDSVSAESAAATGKYYANLRAYASQITSDPPIIGKPMEASVEASFPDSNILGLKVRADVDHAVNNSKESATISIDNIPVKDWVLFQNNEFQISVSGADLRTRFDIQFDGDTIESTWKVTFNRVTFDVQTPRSSLQTSLMRVLSRFPTIEMSGRVFGKMQNLAWEMESNFGRELPTLLKQEFSHQLAAIDDNLQSALLDENESLRQLLSDRLSEISARIDTAYEPSVIRLERLLARVNRLSAGSQQVGRNLSSHRKHR